MEELIIGDGLRHFGYQKEGKFYNGVTMDDIHKPDTSKKVPNVNGIQGMYIPSLRLHLLPD